MTAYRHLIAMAGATFAACAMAAPYAPQQQLQGDVRIWGSPEDGALISRWNEGFRKAQPEARVVASLHGPESTMAGIYTGVADLAFVGRELRLPVENMAFEWVKLHKPATVEVAGATLSAERVATNLAVFVHPDNPVVGLTLAQLDAVFGAEHKRGGAAVRTWGDLGLTGPWRDRPVQVIALPVDSIPALFFRKTVLMGSFKWNPALQEVADSRAAMKALAKDPAAIVYAPLADATPDSKPLPIAAAAGQPFVPLTATTVTDRSYPLARTVHIAFDRTPDKPLDPRVREFLHYVLSDDGQAAITAEGSYLPLSTAAIQQQLKGIR